MATTPDDRTSEDIVEDLLPLHGPYSREHSIRAAALIDDLVRYLNYATQNAEALPYPVAVYDLVGVLKMAAEKLPQTLRQTAYRLDALAGQPEFVDRAMDFHQQPEAAHTAALERAAQARAELRQAAALAGDLAGRLTTAQNLLSALGLSTPILDDE